AIGESFSYMDILNSSAQLEESVGTVFDRIKKFSSMGIALPDEKDIAALRDVVVTKQDIELLRALAQQTAERRITVASILWASNKFEQPIGEIAQRLRQYHSAGLQAPDIEFGDLSGYEVSKEDLIVLSRGLDGRSPWVQGTVSGVHILRASGKLQE